MGRASPALALCAAPPVLTFAPFGRSGPAVGRCALPPARRAWRSRARRSFAGFVLYGAGADTPKAGAHCPRATT